MSYKLSPSKLNTLVDCERCFYLDVKEHIPLPRGHFPSLPCGMDQKIKKIYDEHRAAGTLPTELAHFTEARLFENQKQLDIWRDNFLGLRWHGQHGNILSGAIDDLIIEKEKLVIVDYKTRGWPLKDKNTIPHYYENQLHLYKLLGEKNNLPMADYGHLIFWTPDAQNGAIAFNREVKTIALSTPKAKELLKYALTVLSQDTLPKPGKECQHCSRYRRVERVMKCYETRAAQTTPPKPPLTLPPSTEPHPPEHPTSTEHGNAA